MLPSKIVDKNTQMKYSRKILMIHLGYRNIHSKTMNLPFGFWGRGEIPIIYSKCFSLNRFTEKAGIFLTRGSRAQQYSKEDLGFNEL